MEWIAITAENREAFLPYIVQSQQRNLAEQDVWGVGLIDGRLTCGAAILRGGELISFYIDPKVRGHGGGGLLLGAVKRLAREMGADTLAAEYVFADAAENERLEGWLMKNGFGRPELKALHYKGNTRRIGTARLLRGAPEEGNGLVPFSEIAPGTADELARGLGTHPLLFPENAQGKLDTASSLGYFCEGKLAGYLLFSMLAGELYLSAAVFTPGHPVGVYRTIRVGVARAVRRHPDTAIHVCALYPEVAGMIERISGKLYDLRCEEWHSECPLAGAASARIEPVGLAKAARELDGTNQVPAGALSRNGLSAVIGKK